MPVIFSTSRLQVRPLVMEDLPAFHEMQGNPRVMKYTSGKALTLEENEADLASVISRYKQPENDFWVWAIAHKSDGLFVGTCALIKNDQGENEIGYRLLERFWGHGYGIEITKGLVQYGLKKAGLEELVAYVNRENTPSVRILDATFVFVREFYNEKEGCWDRYYRVGLG